MIVDLTGIPYTEDDAFCKQADVEGVAQRGVYTSITNPSAQQVVDWMGRYAAEIEARMAENGQTYTVKNRGNGFPDTTSSASVARLKVLCEAANAQGAAAEAIAMHETKSDAGDPEASKVARKEYGRLLESIIETCEQMAAGTSAVAVAVCSTSGSSGLPFDDSTEW